MRWPFVSRARLDLALHNLQEMRELHRRDVDFYRVALGVKDARYDALFEKYDALRRDGFVAPIVQPPAPESFGPLTRAALNDMSVGLSAPLTKKMREKATALWLEQRGQANQDEVVAIAVRRGEQVTF